MNYTGRTFLTSLRCMNNFQRMNLYFTLEITILCFFPHGYWETQCGTFPFAFNFHVKMFNSVCLPLGIGLEFVKIQMPKTQRRKHYHPSQFLWVVLNHDLVTSDYAQRPSCSEGIMRPGIELIFGPCPRIDMLAGGETTQSG